MIEDLGYREHLEITWCKGCGNFGILRAVRMALKALQLPANKACFVSGIGCSGYFPHYVADMNTFHGLHGRTLPVASAIKMVNPALTVIAEAGDGDVYSEGGNHFMHTIRRNNDITLIVHDNRMFSLTKAQPSPTTDPGVKTKFSSVYEAGHPLPALNPIAIALASDCTFIARGWSGDTKQLAELIVSGVKHPGFAFINVLQPCVTFNHRNTWKWYRRRVYKLEEDESYDSSNPIAAW